LAWPGGAQGGRARCGVVRLERKLDGVLRGGCSEEDEVDPELEKFGRAEVPATVSGSTGNARIFRSGSGPTNCTNTRRKMGQKSTDFGRNRWNLTVKFGGMIDQLQRQQICGPKPKKTQQNLRSKFELFFWDKIVANFFWGEIGEIGGSNLCQPFL
jgi:hypothetical protein